VSWMIRIVDAAIAFCVPAPAWVARRLRFRLRHFPLTRAAFVRAGVFPVIDHFYDPFYNPDRLKTGRAPRILPAIDFNLACQIALLEAFPAGIEFKCLTATDDPRQFHLANGMFEQGDAELWHQVIRHFKPARIFEIGSGHSTKVARLAIAELERTIPNYRCDHVCIDPYAPAWIDDLGARVLRQTVESVPLEMFMQLERSDVLFIDSSHVIRPQGDVLFEYLELLPSLAPGVIVHIHDIFSPRDYPTAWMKDRMYFWNEQYIVEAFMSHNKEREIIMSGNMMMHECFSLMKSKCVHLDSDFEPRSLYIRRTSSKQEST
jgi:hypothetical protein